jgi:sigma-B regulation protein RsbU (phosphoserine phosphatase)
MSLLKYRLFYFFIAGISWLLLLGITYLITYNYIDGSSMTSIYVLNQFVLSAFILFVFLGFKIHVNLKKNEKFQDSLWNAFTIGAGVLFITLISINYEKVNLTLPLEQALFIKNVVNLCLLSSIVVFVANTFYVWKKMILFQKSNVLDILWHAFEYIMFLSIVTNFFHFKYTSFSFILVAAPITLLGLSLVFNVKWIAFLSYKQKWTSILVIAVLLIICLILLEDVYQRSFSDGLVLNLFDNAFIVALLSFVTLNCAVTLLVLVFNLPTSSVFEQKFGEVMLFQKLHQSLQVGEKEEDVYELLIEASMATIMADAAWLEIREDDGINIKAFKNIGIEEDIVHELKTALRKNQITIGVEPHYIKNKKDYTYVDKISDFKFQSILIFPLTTNNHLIGDIVLLKEMVDGFDKEMVDIINTFVSQASLAIKNYRLMGEAIKMERYKGEIKIAQEVQKSLLPSIQKIHPKIEFSSFTIGANEVGGDYYDFYTLNENKFAIVVGDVSGHGTSAAFNMAQMKGVFQSLVMLDLPTDKFLTHANAAISRCLEKKSFITLSYFIIDTTSQTITYSRGGHCPAIFYKDHVKATIMLEGKGMGLGILRQDQYQAFAESNTVHYHDKDVLVMFTDGLIEAHDEHREQYGYDNIKEIIRNNAEKDVQWLNQKIIEDVRLFTKRDDFEDDCTLLILKFKC